MGRQKTTMSRLAGALAAFAALVLAYPGRPGHAADGSLRLARQPYAGVRCPRPNSIACDRIGLAVWLVKPAVRLSATVAGKRVRMAIPSPVRRAPGGYYCARSCYFEGGLQPAGLLTPGPLHIGPDAGRYYWEGRHPRPLRVQLVAFYRDGSSASTTRRIWLHAGWG
jgi:hypothetical protein